jgi:hypothetical protein
MGENSPNLVTLASDPPNRSAVFCASQRRLMDKLFYFRFSNFFISAAAKIIEMASMRSKVILDKENRKILGADTIVVLILL